MKDLQTSVRCSLGTIILYYCFNVIDNILVLCTNMLVHLLKDIVIFTYIVILL